MKKLSKKLLSVLLVIAMLVPTGALTVNTNAASVSIPDDAVMFNGHYYKAYDIPMSWTDAKAYCENLGGHLVTVTSQAEQTFLENTFFTTASEMWFYMIGGYRESYTSTKWMWVTGEPFNFSNWSTPNEPTQEIWGQNYIWAFSPSAPDSYIRDDGVVIEVPDYKWVSNESTCYHEVYNTEHTGFICEWDTKEYTIAGRTFDKNIDYFTSYTLSSEYIPEFANITAALSKDVYNEKKIKEAYNSLGFNYELCDYDVAYNPLSSACVIGYKKSDYNDDIIILVTVRGSIGSKLTGSDWHGNYLIATNTEGKQIGFSDPADRIYGHINRIIKENNLDGRIRYVLTGHSRGAAVANLLAVRLMENGVTAPYVYNYNFACPDVACKVSFKEYVNIFNLCNREDSVPFTPGIIVDWITVTGASWGKFGQTYWFTKDNEDTLDPFADHSMGLYLEFFDQQRKPEEWGRSFWDKVDDSLNWARGLVAKFHCPVDVIVTDTDGNRIASVIGGEVNYYDSNFGDVIILTDGDEKAIYVSGDKDFNIDLIGTDDGTMTYSVEKCNLMTEEILESKTFENVKLENGKEMYSPVGNAETTEDIELFVIEDDDGENVKTHTINTDGSETEIYHIYDTITIDPTCTEKGYTLHKCKNCDDSYEDEYIDALGHTDENSDGVCDVCTEDFTKSCSCNCHSNAFMQFIHKILCFLYRIFGMEQYRYCGCGKAHW